VKHPRRHEQKVSELTQPFVYTERRELWESFLKLGEVLVASWYLNIFLAGL
jgi:hypothetical protein